VFIYLILLGMFVLDGVSATSCRDSGICSDGYYCISGVCNQCKLGNKCPDGQIQECGLGMYQDTFISTECKKCETGKYADAVGTVNCDLCARGYYNNVEGSSSCTQCPAGTWNDATGQETCANCDSGTWSAELGKTTSACTQCTPGWKTKPNTVAAVMEITACTQCDAGTYSSDISSSACIVCPTSTYSTTPGSTSCAECISGSSHDLTQQTSEAACICAAGTEASSTGCTPCILTCVTGQYVDVGGFASSTGCPALQDITCMACDTCPALQYISPASMCLGDIGIASIQKQSENCELCVVCEEGTTLINKCFGGTTVDLGECIQSSTREESIGTTCSSNTYANPSVNVVFPDKSQSSIAPIVSRDGTYGVEIHQNKLSYTIIGTYWIHDADTVRETHTPGTSLTFVHGAWAFDGKTFFGVASDGTITRSTVVDDVWTTNDSWSVVLDNQISTEDESVVECVAIPQASGIDSEVVSLICSYDKGTSDGAAAYLETIYRDGSRSGEYYEQSAPNRMTNAGVFYDHSKNVLYWNLHTGSTGGPPYKVLAVNLGITYKLISTPIVRFDPGGDFGMKISGIFAFY
jgi:hypothetical protein